MQGKRLDRLQILVTDKELAAIDEFRFRNHLPTRSDAIRELIRRGILAQGFDEPRWGARPGSFGVIEDTE